MSPLDVNDFFPAEHSFPAHASELFTDREGESQAFAHALEFHRASLDADAAVEAMRRNVLVFYGIGGIGKTTLSKRLQRWVTADFSEPHDWGPKPTTAVNATARIDLHSSGGNFDVIRALVEIRTSFGAVRKSWPAFDVAFAAYWNAAHPGEPLPTTSSGDSSFARSTLDLLGQLASDLGVLDVATGLASRLVVLAVTEAKKSAQRREAFRAFDGYERLLDTLGTLPTPSEPQPELAASLAALLSIELNDDDATARPLTVVFVDTFERLQADRRALGEGLVNQIVYSMPYTLFVVTGRNMLDWYDPDRSSLYRYGRVTWPGLVPGETQDPRQHLVGHLSPEDSRRLILKVRDREQLPVSDDVVEKLVVASGGLPLYLDLAADKARSVKSNGGTEVTIEDVTGSLSELVINVLDDVPADEQRAIRAACLLPFFDTALSAAAADVEHGAAERAARRGMITVNPNSDFPYRVHDEVRQAIRAASHHIPGGWSERDWSDAAARAMAEVQRRHDVASAANDGPATLDIIALAVTLMCTAEIEAPWLAWAFVRSPSLWALQDRIPAVSNNPEGQDYLDFVASKSTAGDIETTLRLLRSIADRGSALSKSARRHLAYKLRDNSRYDEAIAELDKLIAINPSQLNLFQRALTFASSRRFTEAVEAGKDLNPDRLRRLTLSIDFDHGLVEEYIAHRIEYVESLRVEHRQREYLDSKGNFARQRILLDGVGSIDEALARLTEAREVGHHIAVKEAIGSLAMLSVGDAAAVRQYSAELEVLERMNTSDYITPRLVFPQLLQAWISDDTARVTALRDLVNTKGPVRGRRWAPAEFVFDAAGMPLKPLAHATEWLEPEDVVRQRWMGHIEGFLTRQGVRPEVSPAP